MKLYLWDESESVIFSANNTNNTYRSIRNTIQTIKGLEKLGHVPNPHSHSHIVLVLLNRKFRIVSGYIYVREWMILVENERRIYSTYALNLNRAVWEGVKAWNLSAPNLSRVSTGTTRTLRRHSAIATSSMDPACSYISIESPHVSYQSFSALLFRT